MEALPSEVVMGGVTRRYSFFGVIVSPLTLGHTTRGIPIGRGRGQTLIPELTNSVIRTQPQAAGFDRLLHIVMPTIVGLSSAMHN